MTDDQLRAALLGLLADMGENASDIAEVLDSSVRVLRGKRRDEATVRMRLAIEGQERALRRAQGVLAALEGGQ